VNKFIIRDANFTDSKSIINLIKELAEFEKEPNSVNLNQSDIEIDGFGNNPKFKCFVAELGNKVVGMALFYSRYSTWEGPTLHLEDLIVSKNHRGKGIGKSLYLKFINEAKINGFKRVEWAVLNWNIDAINFYKSSGAEILKDWRTVQMKKEVIDSYILLNKNQIENI
tara:strand:- start:4883 stop:5386 length:504 start_codon:yes stop_codon:yes gene_type:complete